MQVQNVKAQLEKISQLLNYESSPDTSYKSYSVKGLNSIRETIRALDEIGFLKHRTHPLKNRPWYSGFKNQMAIPSADDTHIKGFISYLKNVTDGVYDFIQLTSHEAGEYQIHIYLPSSYSFSDFETLSNDLKKCIELPAIDAGGSATIISAQPGSVWLVVALATSAAVTIIGRIVKIATQANIEIQKGKIFANYAQNLNLNNELQKTIIDAQKQLVQEVINREVEKVKTDIDLSDDPTKLDRFKLAVTTMSDLLRKEIKFLPSPNLDLELKGSFPEENDNIELVNEELKRLALPSEDSINE